VRQIPLAADTLEAQLAAEVGRVTLDDASARYGRDSRAYPHPELIRARERADETAATLARLVLRDVHAWGVDVGDDYVDTLRLGSVQVVA